MRKTKIIMGMPITIHIEDCDDTHIFNDVFNYLKDIDQVFSTYKKNSLISKINNGLQQEYWPRQVRQIFSLAKKTKKETNGFFNINHNGNIDPSGIVKGYAIYQASKLIKNAGYKNYFVDGSGDIQAMGGAKQNKYQYWLIGIRNPFEINSIVKNFKLRNKGIATSGSYIRGDHIYNPKTNNVIKEIVSLTVIGPNVYEADRFATAAFAMGRGGINFIENKKSLEGYMIDENKISTLTTGLGKYEVN
ncbi:MAG: FAD:protein FMN transferase [Patescibacteria group bacterium]|nr:FAD:protein FMN transferase [Patescibacteria group bacterium]